jgi:plastocyanin
MLWGRAKLFELAGIAVLVGFSACAVGVEGSDLPPGSIAGRVDVRLPLGDSRERPTVRALGAEPERGRPDRRRSVVYLESGPHGAFEELSKGRAVLDQRHETFVPYVLPILVGTTVDFPNRDPFFHNVFSLSKTRRFDLGRYPQGRTKSVRFDRPGVVRVFCEIHSHMSAFILVFAHRYFAATDENGSYRIDGVPPGRYEVVVWTDGEDRLRRDVTVTSEVTSTLDFVVE